MAGRDDRLHSADGTPDQREPGQRDRDRILYSSAFRRLDEVTQVVSPDQGYFHNRLTHTLEVAQIARRIAEKLRREHDASLVEAVGGLDPEVAEAAALAHDLGHPPFGHIAEEEIEKKIRPHFFDGFEGNAQSFRIVTKLSIRRPGLVGLNLTRATLNAILKYPWQREETGGKKERKWGAYRSETDEFKFARALADSTDRRSLEAEIMDWADDTAYAVHDLEDFYRAGRIPLDRLARSDREVTKFFEGTEKRWRQKEITPGYTIDELRTAFEDVLALLPNEITEPYSGTADQRAGLRNFTAVLIGRYVKMISIHEPVGDDDSLVEIGDSAKQEVTILQELIWYYVINHPALATHQFGQRRIVRFLLDVYLEAADQESDWGIFPVSRQEQLWTIKNEGVNEASKKYERIRVVADLISSLTERQATDLYRHLSGASFGSVLDTIVK